MYVWMYVCTRDISTSNGPVPVTRSVTGDARHVAYRVTSLRRMLRAAGTKAHNSSPAPAPARSPEGPPGGPPEVEKLRYMREYMPEYQVTKCVYRDQNLIFLCFTTGEQKKGRKTIFACGESQKGAQHFLRRRRI